jgi:type I restriction enzyme R subunit
VFFRDDKAFSRKTAKLVQEHTKTDAIKATLDVYEINGDTLRKIEASKASDTEKVFNLLKSLAKAIRDNVDRMPYLFPIGERADVISQLFKERQRNSKETLEDLRRVIEDMNAARREQAERDMSAEVFTIFWMLKKEGIDHPEDKANQMRAVLEHYPHWRKSASHEREVKNALYAVLYQSGMKDTKTVTKLGQTIMRALKGGAA